MNTIKRPKKTVNSYALCLISILFVISCKQKNTPALDVNTIKKDAGILLDNWHNAASEANFDRYFNAMDSTAVFVGTDASEVWNKKAFQEFSKPHFDKGKAWDFKVIDRHLYIEHASIIWFDELLDTWMGLCRGSGVIAKQHNNWVIKHYVLSLTVPNETIQPVIELKKAKDSLFVLNTIKP